MASGSTQPRPVPIDLLCYRCKDHSLVEKDDKISLQNTYNNVKSQDLANLQEDLLELNKVLKVVKSDSVKDAISDEINLISAKIISLQVPISANPDKEPLWPEVVKRKKKISPAQRRSTYSYSDVLADREEPRVPEAEHEANPRGIKGTVGAPT